jgi:hypothetical protein
LRDTRASQTVKVKCKAHNFFQIYTFLDSDYNALIENRNNFQFSQEVCPKSSGKRTCLKPQEISIMVIPILKISCRDVVRVISSFSWGQR